MNYVEENFKGAYTLGLSSDEIKYLKDFLSKQINIESTLCILLIPRYKEIDRRYYDDSNN